MKHSLDWMSRVIRDRMLKLLRGHDLRLLDMETQGSAVTIKMAEYWNGGIVDGKEMVEITTWKVVVTKETGLVTREEVV